MAKSTTPKWAVIATHKRYSLHVLKGDAEKALTEWKEGHEAHGCDVFGSKSGGYFVKRPHEELATLSARVVKLADHPVCYIGVMEAVVAWLRELEATENPLFEQASARAKALSEEWSHVEAV